MAAFTIDFSDVTQLNDRQFERLCDANPEIKFEGTPTGALVIMSPTGGETGNRNIELAADTDPLIGSGSILFLNLDAAGQVTAISYTVATP